MKRSATLAKSLRSPLGDSSGKSDKDKSQDGKPPGAECFAGFLDEIIPLVAAEQNFLSEFFHITSSTQAMSFIELAQSGDPNERQLSDLNRRRVPEQDKAVARMLFEAMGDIFGSLGNEMQVLVAHITSGDPLYVSFSSIFYFFKKKKTSGTMG